MLLHVILLKWGIFRVIVQNYSCIFILCFVNSGIHVFCVNIYVPYPVVFHTFPKWSSSKTYVTNFFKLVVFILSPHIVMWFLCFYWTFLYGCCSSSIPVFFILFILLFFKIPFFSAWVQIVTFYTVEIYSLWIKKNIERDQTYDSRNGLILLLEKQWTIYCWIWTELIIKQLCSILTFFLWYV